MYTNHLGPDEYPHNGYFYYVGIDDTKPLDEQFEEEIILFETDFDIAEGSDLNMDSFKLFFPFDYRTDTLMLKQGNTFKGTIWGSEIKGRVAGIYPSQLGGCTVLLNRI